MKWSFLDEYGPVALKATTRKMTRVYVDLFAGPGLNSLSGSGDGEIIEGSPLRALELRTADAPPLSFTDAYLVNQVTEEDDALRRRIEQRIAAGRSRIPARRIHLLHGDANQVVYSILREVDPRAYVFVFADPNAPSDLPWRTIEALRRHRGHQSVDLYMLFPSDMGLRRMMGYTIEQIEVNAPAMDLFYGGHEWRTCLPHRRSEALRGDFIRCLEATYLTKLRTLWAHADAICDVRREDGQRLYRMLFASDDPAGAAIGRWAKGQVGARSSGDQLGFSLGD